MKKLAPVVAVVVLAGAMAVMVYYATRAKVPIDPPVNGEIVPKNLTFKTEDFMLNFDLDSDGKVTFEEFGQRYGQGDPPLVFTERDGAQPLPAEKAFKRWDRNQNGYVEADDIKQLTDKAWEDWAKHVAERDLQPTAWKDQKLALNEHQLRTLEAEKGALARGDLPFAGAFWAPQNLAGRWSRVKDANGEVFGYASERNGRIWILTKKAELIVKDPAKVEVTQLPADDPHMLYVAEILKTPFDDTAKNLELARKCKEWGLKSEAGTLYARVLLFDRANQEALDELGYRLEGEKFVSKG